MLLLNLFFAGFAAAVPLSAHSLHEARDVSRIYLHDGESKRVDPHAILPIRIALTQSNLDKGHDYLMQVSDPHSEHFGKHWTLEEIHDHFAPSEETKEAVRAWLEYSGIDRDDISEPTSGGWFGIDVPASVAERLFLTEYYESHGANGAVDVGCDKYHIPSHLSDHIDFITPGIGATPLHKRSRPLAPQLRALKNPLLQRRALNLTGVTCGELMTPACIRALYDIPASSAASYSSQKNALGVFEFQDVYDQEDLDLFFKYFAKNVPLGTHPKLVSIDGATAPTTPKNGGGESNVDLTLAFSLIYPQTITLYQTGFTKKQQKDLIKEASGSPLSRELLASDIELIENFLNAVDGSFCTAAAKKEGLDCGTTSLTQVLSVSYGTPEILLPFKFAQRACSEYMKLGLKGHTIVFSSGDHGPAGNKVAKGNITAVSNACIDVQNTQNSLLNGTVFNPLFPATCPYVLTVGATQLTSNETVKDPESVMRIPEKVVGLPSYITFGSSGGFSNYFKEASYQASAVSKYVAKYTPGYKTYKFPGSQKVGANGGIYAVGGRAFPDVAANGAYLASFADGQFTQEFGTSLATPIWASLITLINEERAAKGKGPVGFINPTLYKNTQIFTDITAGFAPGCGTDGFAAAPGWDPTTGLGTPIYPELLKVFLALP